MWFNKIIKNITSKVIFKLSYGQTNFIKSHWYF